ncbi:uncharacterized protein VTP21DRAFT_6253 [Calcarisporiella thermophila]|uniref:uncharacterized protein n=1 Tax=Calcarisporiella thermophila TaxID=911321 RepID=UPI0037448D01
MMHTLQCYYYEASSRISSATAAASVPSDSSCSDASSLSSSSSELDELECPTLVTPHTWHRFKQTHDASLLLTVPHAFYLPRYPPTFVHEFDPEQKSRVMMFPYHNDNVFKPGAEMPLPNQIRPRTPPPPSTRASMRGMGSVRNLRSLSDGGSCKSLVGKHSAKSKPLGAMENQVRRQRSFSLPTRLKRQNSTKSLASDAPTSGGGNGRRTVSLPTVVMSQHHQFQGRRLPPPPPLPPDLAEAVARRMVECGGRRNRRRSVTPAGVQEVAGARNTRRPLPPRPASSLAAYQPQTMGKQERPAEKEEEKLLQKVKKFLARFKLGRK